MARTDFPKSRTGFRGPGLEIWRAGNVYGPSPCSVYCLQPLRVSLCHFCLSSIVHIQCLLILLNGPLARNDRPLGIKMRLCLTLKSTRTAECTTLVGRYEPFEIARKIIPPLHNAAYIKVRRTRTDTPSTKDVTISHFFLGSNVSH